MPTLQVGPHFSELCGQKEAMLRDSLAEDHRWHWHEVHQLQETFYVSWPHVHRDPTFGRATEEGICGYGTHIVIVQLLRSGMTVAQVERFMEDQVREHYLMQKSKYIELWDKVGWLSGHYK